MDAQKRKDRLVIGRYAIDNRGRRIKLHPLTDAADADAGHSPYLNPEGDGIPFRDLDEQGNPILFPTRTDDPRDNGDDWRGDRERDNAENDPHSHRTAR